MALMRVTAASRVTQPRSTATMMASNANPVPPLAVLSSIAVSRPVRRSRARPLTGWPPSQKKRKVCRCTCSSSSSSGRAASSAGLMARERRGLPEDPAAGFGTVGILYPNGSSYCMAWMGLMSRIETLIASMTLAEKLGQLTMTASSFTVTGPVIAGDSTDAIRSGTIGNLLNMVGAGPVRAIQRLAVEESRLKIPLLIGLDIIHGHRSLFPVPLAEGGVFDPVLWEATAREAAIEGAADGLAMTFAPMLDVSRDPRWGRTVEGSGEDSWLATQMAVAKVRGFQGVDLAAPDALAACAKHFCAYAPVMAGREYASVDVSERTVQEVHLPPFAAAVQ